MSSEDAIRHLRQETDEGKFSRQYVEAFLELVRLAEATPV
jgi:hypothetical protein